jgi:hypothetical protein
MKRYAGLPGMPMLGFPRSCVVGFPLSNKVSMYPTPRHAWKIRTVRSVPPGVFGRPVPPQLVYCQSMDVNEIAE